MEYAVSVIIPVYQVERYIEECIDSLINQTIDSIQLVIVDNGCLDKSMEIVKEKVGKLENVKILSLDNNVGLPKARNIGMSEADGEYIAFVDSDDRCNKSMFEKMYNLAKKNNADIVTCNIASFEEEVKKSTDHHNELWYEDGKCHSILGYPQQWMEMAAWGKLINKEYAKRMEFSFTEYSLCCEEVPGMTRLYLNTDKFCTFNETLYFYRNRPNSLSKKTTKKYVDDFIYAIKKQDYELKNKDFNDAINMYYILMMRLLLTNHILVHIDKNDIEYGINKIGVVFDIFKKSFIKQATTYNSINYEVIEALREQDIKQYRLLMGGIWQ